MKRKKWLSSKAVCFDYIFSDRTLVFFEQTIKSTLVFSIHTFSVYVSMNHIKIDPKVKKK